MSRGRYIALGLLALTVYAALIFTIHRIAADAPRVAADHVLAKGDRLDICREACGLTGAAP